MSFHAVFEGLAIGLESDQTKIWILFAGMCNINIIIVFYMPFNFLIISVFILLFTFFLLLFSIFINRFSGSNLLLFLLVAVGTHKYVISFCVGLELFNANTPKPLYATNIIVFSLMSMVGIAIGTGLTSSITDDSSPYAAIVGILQVRWNNP